MEILISLALGTVAITGVVFVLALNSESQLNIHNATVALGLVQEMLLEAKEESIYDLVDFEEQDDVFTKKLMVTFESPYRAKVLAIVSWGKKSSQQVRRSFWYSDKTFIADVVDCPVFHTSWKHSFAVDHELLMLPATMTITDGFIYKKFLYLATDSSVVSEPDIYVIDMNNPRVPTIATSTHTGPGIASFSRNGDFIFIANTGVNQLQIVSIENPIAPKLISEMKLPGVTAANGGGIGRSTFVLNDLLYIGLTKATGPELFEINISNPYNIESFALAEVNSGVADIFVWNDVVAVANASDVPLKLFSQNGLEERDEYVLPNWQIQSGQQVYILGSKLYLGRNTAGIGTKLPEITQIDMRTNDVVERATSGSVDSLISTDIQRFVLTYANGQTRFKVFDQISGNILAEENITGRGIKILCDEHYLYTLVNDYQNVFNIFIPHE